ncbi:putative ribosomal protein S8 [Rosa chinensis]|uniref:Putative ribosomal protein S8 n=1 Tax=Rosa chinensis TaxID=74649 RepID=A0A2P6SD08_ROSCH|nr:putative ribosomal protein S8 [Rosa chinensis]
MYNAEKRGKRQFMIRPSSKVIIKFLIVMQKHGYIGEFEYVDDHRSGKIVVELNGRLNKCGVISPRFDVGVKEIEGWTARLLPSRQASLLSSIQFGPQDGWLSSFYSCLIKKYDKENVVEANFGELEKERCNSNTSDLSFIHTLKTNTDLLVCKAEYYHQCGEYQKCFELTSFLLEKDTLHLKSTLVHLAAAMELGNSNELYLMACNLVKDYLQKALSWFSVGCYYYCIKKYDQSRRYFSKATNVDGNFPPVWIGYGNAYSAQDEGDQAMSIYRTAARLFPGCHLPTLYIGKEYMRTHSYKLAEQGTLNDGRVIAVKQLSAAS